MSEYIDLLNKRVMDLTGIPTVETLLDTIEEEKTKEDVLYHKFMEILPKLREKLLENSFLAYEYLSNELIRLKPYAKTGYSSDRETVVAIPIKLGGINEL